MNRIIAICTVFIALTVSGQQAKRTMEKLNRGLVAVHVGEKGVYLSWRLLKTDPKTVAFHVYRDGKQVNRERITDSTNFPDPRGRMDSQYTVQAIAKGVSYKRSAQIRPQKHQYSEIPLKPPTACELPDKTGPVYKPGAGAVGDLDGVGDYELVLKWEG